MKSITRKLVSPWILCAPVILFFSIGNAEECTAANPCKMTIYAAIGTEAAHIKYGDFITLSYDGKHVNLIEHVEAWKNDKIQLKPVVIWLPGQDARGNTLVPGFEFDIKVEDEMHPDGNLHKTLRLYRDPGSTDLLVVAPKTAHGKIHGGTAHMQQ